MRDEVLADWRKDDDGSALHVYCHVSGGLVLGTAGWRYAIFQHELPLVLEAFGYGDRALCAAHLELDGARIRIHFHARQRRYRRVERWGTPADYRLRAMDVEQVRGGGTKAGDPAPLGRERRRRCQRSRRTGKRL